ncbi:DUF365 domain-containing protein [Methanothermobacter sp. THM-1]|uniref:DUF365 domain-containing protein n=1 Tax=Methanothermobacter sp. THM-1 TaxID=2606911 RepID=UPI00136711A2|nr:DUF365 domain-containing protein [Methanothermobacter sp. THM-1]QHN06656.1 DUF365 domain-containing protein [Methanothermobacter sp. THM-1]
MEKKIMGVSHPVPTEYARRIYDEGKDVFVGKSYLGRVSPGDKFIIYESHGAKAYTGWADIKSIGKQKTADILKKYGDRLIVTEEEFREYSKGRREMNVIEFENFEKFKNPVKPKRFVTVAGKYIDEEEFKMIEGNKD